MSRFGSGHINDTFLVTLEEDGKAGKVILQRMNRSIFTKPVELMENVMGVTAFLREKIFQKSFDRVMTNNSAVSEIGAEHMISGQIIKADASI